MFMKRFYILSRSYTALRKCEFMVNILENRSKRPTYWLR